MDHYGGPDGIPTGFAMLVLQVSLAVGFSSETIGTQFAFKGFFSSMSSHVSGQCAFIIGTISTCPHIADVWRLA